MTRSDWDQIRELNKRFMPAEVWDVIRQRRQFLVGLDHRVTQFLIGFNPEVCNGIVPTVDSGELPGKRFKREREQLKISQVDVAKTAGICRQTLHVFESGRHTPKPATLAAIFGALDRLKTKPPRKKSRQAV